MHCIFTGETQDPRWPDYFREIENQIFALGPSAQISILGTLPREEQITLMGHAVAVVQPSLFEGWSTVVEEARALGRTVILSRIPVHLQQSPPDAKFFDPADPEALAQLLDASWPAADADREEQIESGTQDQFVLGCARRFLQVADTARRNYRPEAYDPLAIPLHMLSELSPPQEGSGDRQLAIRALAGIRGLLREHPGS